MRDLVKWLKKRSFKKLSSWFAMVSVILFLAGCTQTIQKVAYPTLSDGRYDSEFPYKNCSKQLERVMESVKKVNVIAYYEMYVFGQEQRLRKEQISGLKLKRASISHSYFNKTSSGTGTIISAYGTKVVLLTCAHVVDYPDSSYSHFIINGESSPYIQSIAIKLRQEVYVTEASGEGNLEVILMDRRKDIALLGQEFRGMQRLGPVLDYPAGESKELEWGSFVYLLGFPKGYRMITRGIVSNPNRDKSGGFLVDALFNRGFSGGIILAIRDGVPNFELVGMAKSVSAQFDYMLVPEKELSEYQYDPYIPYTGNLYVETISNIDYGITHSISIETIREFVKDNKDVINRAGYRIEAPCLRVEEGKQE